MKPTTKEIEEQRDWALQKSAHEQTDFPGMTYEQGVEAALSWVLDGGKKPMEE